MLFYVRFIYLQSYYKGVQAEQQNFIIQQYQQKQKLECVGYVSSQSNSKQPSQTQQLKKIVQFQSGESGSQIIKVATKTKKKYYKKSKREDLLLSQIKKSIFCKFIARQIQNVVDQLNYESNCLFPIKVIAFERVRVFIQSLLPYTSATLFGPNAIGLSLPTSDINILLLNFPCSNKEEATMFLSHIQDHMNKMKWAQNCQLVANAKVPILKLRIDCNIPFLSTKTENNIFTIYDPILINQLNTDQSNIPLISVDVSINLDQVLKIGYESTQLMKRWMIKLPHLQKLLILFKHIFSLNGFNKNFKGGIGSYCLFVMISAYLQTYPPSDQDSLYKIFRDIVVWYKSFDNLHYIILLQEKGSSFLKEQDLAEQLYTREQNHKMGLLRLIDPITSKIISNSCTQFDKIKNKCQWIIDQIDKIQLWLQEDIKKFQNHKKDEYKINGVQILRMMQNKKCQDKLLKQLSQKYGQQVQNIIQYVQPL